MIQGGSLDYYHLVTLHALDFLEAPVDYLFRMTLTIVISHIHLMLMMLIHQMFIPGIFIGLAIHSKVMKNLPNTLPPMKFTISE